MTTVYGVQISPFVRKVLLVLKAKGIPYTNPPVNPMDPPKGFDRVSPLGKIPAFEDDKLTLADSAVICEYLEQRYPQISLYPTDLVDRAKVKWLEKYADTEVIAVLGPIFFERVLKPSMLQQTPDEERVNSLITQSLPGILNYLDQQLRGKKTFLHGNVLTIADIATTTHFINLSYSKVDVDATKWPNLAAYLKQMTDLPLFKGFIESDQPLFAE
ncbi:glutathione S-transferase family protein [Photobacterium galatheae]|uniref:glutathione S-transferase family protein n=1 Tax=Photobacterium galatheae TaxID=1654360 RepID=UPI00202CD535|nr:glutathione S-transferase family protein [Photobacterium galatheae]MCM0148826.1 glutathione S-transferase family protein [Photobacterium galatheae]